MKVGEDVIRVVIYLDKEALEQVDRICEECDVSRTRVLAACVDSGLDDLRFLRFLGLTPRRLQKVGQMLHGLGLVKPQGLHLDDIERRDNGKE